MSALDKIDAALEEIKGSLARPFGHSAVNSTFFSYAQAASGGAPDCVAKLKAFTREVQKITGYEGAAGREASIKAVRTLGRHLKAA